MKNMTSQILAIIHSKGHQPSLNMPSLMADSGHGARQPPRNNVAATAETLSMLTYSARKNQANFIEEYSTMCPATSSPSAYGRSKGRRLTSPTIEMRQMMKAGASTIAHHRSVWALTIWDVEAVPDRRKTLASASVIASS